MRMTTIIGGLILMGLLGYGCDQQDETTVAPGAAETTAGETGAGIDAASAAAKEQAAGAVEGAKEAGQEAVSTIEGDAQKLLDQAMQYIKHNKFELADQTLTKLERMKAQLPETMQKSIANARSALDTAKKGASMLPGSGQ